MDRKKRILVTQYALVMTTVAMGLLVASGFLEVWHLFAFTLLTGVAWAFVDPVRQTLVPALVPREDLMNAVALNSAAFNLKRQCDRLFLHFLWTGNAECFKNVSESFFCFQNQI
jgi:hypothetical protein